MKRDVLQDDPDAEIVIPKDQRYIWRAKVPRQLCPYVTSCAGSEIVWHLHQLVRRQRPFLYKPEREGYEAIGREPFMLLTREKLPPLPLLILYSQASSRAIGRREIERSLPTEYRMQYHGERRFTAAEWALAVEFNKWVHNAGFIGKSTNQPMPVGVDGKPWNAEAVAVAAGEPWSARSVE
jgi:hypothetical protein